MLKIFRFVGIWLSVLFFFYTVFDEYRAAGCGKSPQEHCIPYTLKPPRNETCMALGANRGSTAEERPAASAWRAGAGYRRYAVLRGRAHLLCILLGALAMLLDGILDGASPGLGFGISIDRARPEAGPPSDRRLRAVQSQEYVCFSRQLAASGGMLLPFAGDFCLGYFSLEIGIAYFRHLTADRRRHALPFALSWMVLVVGSAVELLSKLVVLSPGSTQHLPADWQSPCDYFMTLKVNMISRASLLPPVLLAFHVLELLQLMEGWNCKGCEGASREGGEGREGASHGGEGGEGREGASHGGEGREGASRGGEGHEGASHEGREGAACGGQPSAPPVESSDFEGLTKRLRRAEGCGRHLQRCAALLLGLSFAWCAVGTAGLNIEVSFSALRHLRPSDHFFSEAVQQLMKHPPSIHHLCVSVMLLFEYPLLVYTICHVLWCMRFMRFILALRLDFVKDTLTLPQPSETASAPERRGAAPASATRSMRRLTQRLLPSESRSVDLTECGSVVWKWLENWEHCNRATFISILIMNDVVGIIVYMITVSVLSLLATDGLHVMAVLTGQRIDVTLRYMPLLRECTFWQSDLFALVSAAGWAFTLLMCMRLCLMANSMARQEASFINEQKFRMWQGRAGLGTQELVARGMLLEHLAEHIEHSSHTATILGFPITPSLVDRITMAQTLGAITYFVSKLMTADLF